MFSGDIPGGCWPIVGFWITWVLFWSLSDTVVRGEKHDGMRVFKQQIARAICLSVHEFKLKRATSSGFEFKNMKETLQKANLVDGT